MSIADELDDGVEIMHDGDGGMMVEALTRGEIDIQIRTAKQYPRSIKAFRQQALELATLDEETAASMFYVLPRGGKKLEGPSVRLAEVVGSSFGNLRYAARIVSMDDKFITAQGACHDLEKNIAVTVEVKRRITNKDNKRFNDDMIQVTSNAACSIALRQAIFKVVPFSLVKPIYEASRLTSVGKASSFNESRHKAFDWFKKAGATEPQILAYLDRKGIEDVTMDDLISLRGLVTAIKDGDTTIEDALTRPQGATGGKVSKSDLNETIKPAEAKATAATDPKPESAKPASLPTADQIVSGLMGATTQAECDRLTEGVFGPDGRFDDPTTDDIMRLYNEAKQRIRNTPEGQLFAKSPQA